MPADKRSQVDRVLVVLDLTRQSLTVLHTAAQLAALRDAELVALFIEDADLIRLAALPFSTEVVRQSGVSRRMEVTRLTRAIERRVEQAREALDQMAVSFGLPASLRVSRGRYLAEALASAAEQDVVVLGRMPGVAHGRGVVSASETRPGERVTRPVPALRHGSVWALFDGSESAKRALVIARELAGDNATLVIALAAKKDDAVASLERSARQELASSSRSAQFVSLPASDPYASVACVSRGRPGLLVLPRRADVMQSRAARMALESSGFPVVLSP